VADVVVAGAGVSGVFAAIAAARQGARTIVVDRFGTVGGNMGPGMIAGGGFLPGRPHPDAGYDSSVCPGLYGIAMEFINTYAALGGGSLAQFSTHPSDYIANSNLASHVALQMLEESGATPLLSTQVADPIMDGDRAIGLFVENKSGRRAIVAPVVVDATGEADVARRAGAPVLYPRSEYHEIDAHAPTGMGLYYLLGGVDWERFEAWRGAVSVTDEDVAWGEEALGADTAHGYYQFLPAMREASRSAALDLCTSVELEGVKVGLGAYRLVEAGTPGMAHGRVQPERLEAVDASNGDHISALEAAIRTHLFQIARIWKRCVPGFEDSHVVSTAPFLGSRGGPCIEGEQVLTMDDCMAARRFDDVMYLYGEGHALRHTCGQGECKWADVPYRTMVPLKTDGLLATGRSASCIPDTLLRNRMAVMVMGEACGIAAGLSVKHNVTPRDLDVKAFQEALLDAGFHLGNRARLRELGLA